MTTGLEEVVVAETRLSGIDGQHGRLLIGGLAVAELADSKTFAEVCALLWGRKDVPRLDAELRDGRQRAFERLADWAGALALPDAMDAIRGCVAQLPSDTSAAGLTAAIAVATAAWSRRARGLSPLAPDLSASHAADYLRMIRGEPAGDAEARALETYWATVVDHGLNASTFAARVVASTQSDRVSAIVAAIGALKGRLHGGAPGPVLDMFDAIEREGDAEAWLRRHLAAGHRIMGMGHRVYRVRDPRAAVLEAALERLRQDGAPTGRLALARQVEQVAERLLAQHKPGRRLRANVEFYTATLLEALGLPRELFTPTFAASRVVGWCAHVAEQQRSGRLLRPRARYVGPAAGLVSPYSPSQQRSPVDP